MQMGAWNWEGQWGIERARKTALQGPGRCEIDLKKRAFVPASQGTAFPPGTFALCAQNTESLMFAFLCECDDKVQLMAVF